MISKTLVMRFIIQNNFIIWLFILPLLVNFSNCNKPSQEVPINPKPDTTLNGVTQTDIISWITSPGESIYLKKQNTVLNFINSSATYPNTISVDSTKTFQKVDGFGFALTGGSAYLINQLIAAKKENLLNELFSTDSTFIGISYLRISIGASDLDANVFSYDDIDVSLTDFELQNFSIEPDTYNLIPILKLILAINPSIKILGSPWSAPAWMKTNQNSKGGSLKPECYDVYANYLVKYIQEMKAQGINIDAITPQNEPLNPYNNPSMQMSALEQANFIKNFLGPKFDSANIDTKIIIYDHNCDVSSYALTILADNEAKQYVDGSAFHLYAGDISALTQVHDAYPDKNVYFTEQWVGGPSNFAGDFKWHIKNLIIGAMRNWSKNVIEWNLASDPNYYPHTDGGCTNCLGALTVQSSVTRNVSYYVIAHASKFVKTGSTRIASNLISGLPNVAFKTPDGKKVLIVLNENESLQSFNLRFGEKTVTTSLPAGAAGTYVW